MKNTKNIRMCFIFPEKLYKMIDRLADDAMTTKTGIIKNLIMDKYNEKYGKTDKDSR